MNTEGTTTEAIKNRIVAAAVGQAIRTGNDWTNFTHLREVLADIEEADLGASLLSLWTEEGIELGSDYAAIHADCIEFAGKFLSLIYIA